MMHTCKLYMQQVIDESIININIMGWMGPFCNKYIIVVLQIYSLYYY